MPTRTLPSYPHDLFSDEALLEPERHYRALRELGPVVWLDAHQVYVLPRYDEVRAALRDEHTFRSGHGVGLNELINARGQGTTLMTDGPEHDSNRRLEFGTLTPKALRSIGDPVRARAERLVGGLVERGRFDGVADLARALPLTVVPELLGWPAGHESDLLRWAAATFDVLGPMNERAERAIPDMLEMLEFAERLAGTGAITPGSVGARILAAAERGDIPREHVPAALVDYLAPSLDTTISAIGNALWLLARHPGQWRELHGDPELVPAAFTEALRLLAPIRCFSRVTTTEVTIGGHPLPAGSRVLLHYASANRDERRFAEPDRFDIHRADAGGHLAFGVGRHACPGQSLARLESHALLTALARRAGTIALTGPPTRTVNNLISGFAALPLAVTPGGGG
jgi:cytochrome P450